MKVALLSPYTPDGNIVPSLGLLTLAAVLRQDGHDVALFDQAQDKRLPSGIADFRPDILGVTSVTSAVLSGKHAAKEFKSLFPKAMVIFGGPHPSATPEATLAWEEVDFVVQGEGETSLRMLAEWAASRGSTAELKKIPNLHYKTDQGVGFTFQAPFLSSAELAELPFPAYDLLDIDHVTEHLRHGLFRKGKRALNYMATRGCPHRCTFCCRVMGTRIRRKPAEQVVMELESLVQRFSVDEVYIEDDNFTAQASYATSILDAVIERRLPISLKFANGVRIDTLNDALLEKMRAAGCYTLSFGLESGSPATLQRMRKDLDLEHVRHMVGKVTSHGFSVGANMIVGYPEETRDDILESYEFFKSLNLDSMALVNLIPFPGTVVRQICDEKGYLTPLADNWDNYYFDIKDPKILIETPALPQEELQKIMRMLFLRIYANPKRVAKLLRNMSPGDMLEGVRTVARRFFAR